MSPEEKFSEIEIREELERILSNPAFKNSGILSGFLKFVVDETLAGRDREIKEYSIGVNVLSRKSDFNPQLDSIVRMHAGRLRRALNEYFNSGGKKDPIYIEVPKGGYIPIFHSPKKFNSKVAEKINPARNRPVVAVLPFRNISKDSSRDFFADGLGEQLSTDLTHFHDIAVISYYSSRHAAGKTSDVKEAAKLLGARYLVTGSIQHDNKYLGIRVQLIFGDSGEQLWAKTFERNNTAAGLFEIQNEIVKSILTAIGGYYGVIFRDVLQAPHHTDRASGIAIYDAIFWYYHFQKVSTIEAFQKATSALEDAVKADPNYALAWAMLGELYVDDKAYEFKKVDNPAAEGLKCALRAVQIDPNCQHAYQALAWIYLFHHNREECLNAADQCIAMNPNASDKVGAMGFVLICAGEFERGFKLLNESILQNPYCPWWFNGGFVFYFLYKKDYREALRWAEKMLVPASFWDPLLNGSVLGHLNRIEDAGRKLDLLKQLMPDAVIHVPPILESFLLSQDLKKEILDGLNKAGLNKGHQKAGIKT